MSGDGFWWAAFPVPIVPTPLKGLLPVLGNGSFRATFCLEVVLDCFGRVLKLFGIVLRLSWDDVGVCSVGFELFGVVLVFGGWF